MFLPPAGQRLFQRILLWRRLKTKDPDGCLCRYPVKETEGRRRRRRSSSLSRIINLRSREPPGSLHGRPPWQLFHHPHTHTRGRVRTHTHRIWLNNSVVSLGERFVLKISFEQTGSLPEAIPSFLSSVELSSKGAGERNCSASRCVSC